MQKRNGGEENSDEDEESDDDGDTNDASKRFNFQTQHINVLFFTIALLAENYYEFALAFTKKRDLMQSISSLMQVSEEKSQSRKWKNRLIKGASMFVSSLTSVKEGDAGSLQLGQKPNDVQRNLQNQTGLVANFCLNLVSMKELNNLKCMI